MKTSILTSLLIAFFLVFAVSASAQDQSDLEAFYPDFSADEALQMAPVKQRPLTLSYGGWITPAVVDDRDGGRVLTTSITTLRLWLQATLWENAYLHVRGRDMYLHVIDEEYRSEVESPDNIIDLDVGFISMASSGRAVQFQAGRRFFILGTGLVFNGRGDGAELRLHSSVADLKIFGLYTGLLSKDTNPYGLSSKDLSDGAKRIFAGGSLERGFANQTAYLMGMAQIDRAEEESGEKNRYHSQYYGGGLKGLLMDGMDYYAEFVYQRGTNSLTGEEVDITAMAGLFGINYYFDYALKPAILLQYAYGSGDDGTDEKDNFFNYFGTYVGGFALRPKLQNLHVFRIGLSAVPFFFLNSPRLNRMTVQGRYTYYMKDKVESDAGGGLGASVEERAVGHGIDASLRWRIYDDLAFFLNYGYFIPGDAFASTSEERSFVMAGFNLSF